MPLQMFPLLQDNTRLIRYKETLYKVKVKFKMATFPSEGLQISRVDAHNQIEEVFRAVLYINERNRTLKTIATPNFLVKTFKIPWSFPSKCSGYVFQQKGKTLKVFDHMFEFHISNKSNDSKDRSEERVITHVDKRLDNSDSQCQAEKMGCKPALVIISDLNLDAPGRFGRTKDGQLYKVCGGNAEKGHKGTVTDTNESGMAEMRSPKEVTDNSKISESDSNGGTKMRKDKVVQEAGRNKMHVSAGDNADGGVPSKYNKSINNNLSKKGKVGNTIVSETKASRDKHSLRESELKSLDFKNIQECRLRSRKPSNEHAQSSNLRERANVVKNAEVETSEAESSQTEVERSQTEAERSQTKAESSQSEADGSQSEGEDSQTEANGSQIQNRNNRYRTKLRTRHVRRKTLKLSKNKRKHSMLSIRKESICVKKRKSAQTKPDSDVEGGINAGRMLHSLGQHNESSALMTSSGSESRLSPIKTKRSNKKRKIESSDSQSADETKSASQGSGKSKKIKLYGGRHSPQVILDHGSKHTVEISSPRVSTVLPLKRSHISPASQTSQRSLPHVASPRLTRQSVNDLEARRIASLREERPSQLYRDIMLSQRRDRHLVEQAENAETDKLHQLYEPTVLRRSPRLNGKQEAKKRRSSGLWGKIMETLITPTKKYMFGKKK